MTILTPDQLTDGYHKAVSNAFRLLEAAMTLTAEFPEVALGLAEIGQEETGKSLSFLAAFSLSSNQEAWRWFWSGWKDHQLKAYRAFLYELISPVRIETGRPDGSWSSGLPTREEIKHEKEFSFYVNFDSVSGRFLSPQETVDRQETYNRVLTLLYLAVTAWCVKATLNDAEPAFRRSAFSEIAFRICSERLYQVDMPAVFAEFERRSTKHRSLMESLRARLAEGKDYLESTLGRPRVPPPDRGLEDT